MCPLSKGFRIKNVIDNFSCNLWLGSSPSLSERFNHQKPSIFTVLLDVISDLGVPHHQFSRNFVDGLDWNSTITSVFTEPKFNDSSTSLEREQPSLLLLFLSLLVVLILEIFEILSFIQFTRVDWVVNLPGSYHFLLGKSAHKHLLRLTEPLEGSLLRLIHNFKSNLNISQMLDI